MKKEFGLDVSAGGGGLRSLRSGVIITAGRMAGPLLTSLPALGGLNTQQPLTGGRCRTSHIIPHRQLTSLIVMLRH